MQAWWRSRTVVEAYRAGLPDGILFKDLSRCFADAAAFRRVIDAVVRGADPRRLRRGGRDRGARLRPRGRGRVRRRGWRGADAASRASCRGLPTRPATPRVRRGDPGGAPGRVRSRGACARGGRRARHWWDGAARSTWWSGRGSRGRLDRRAGAGLPRGAGANWRPSGPRPPDRLVALESSHGLRWRRQARQMGGAERVRLAGTRYPLPDEEQPVSSDGAFRGTTTPAASERCQRCRRRGGAAVPANPVTRLPVVRRVVVPAPGTAGGATTKAAEHGGNQQRVQPGRGSDRAAGARPPGPVQHPVADRRRSARCWSR